MKKCPNCGAIQNDSRNVCIDCGARLGKRLSETEAAAAANELSIMVEGAADRAEDFYVSGRNRVFGIVSIIGIIAFIIIIIIASAQMKEIESTYSPDDWTSVVIAGNTAYGGPQSAVRSSELEHAVVYSFSGIPLLITAALLFLFPRLAWKIDTWGHRLWYYGDLSPSYFGLLMYKVSKWATFTLGCFAFAGALLSLIGLM